ncbi:tyrosine-type recombinase/integrase [Natrinema thermotolerans]|uniref:tyrosine-type recombinase/integrase n=1 Tax=Natrinema thermotolerans TaxID=121872 RepID=UPI0006784EC6|nr:tyrosine-type recombinase/integrase [Natrinema thermotolerans]
MVTHSKELALDAYEFEHFVAGAKSIDDRLQRLEAEYVAFVGGRLGLRAGEILHSQESWVNWRKRRIEVPYHEPCSKGYGEDCCGYCSQQARQKSEYSELSLSEARLEVLQEQLSEVPQVPGDVRRQLQTAHIVHIDSDLSKEALDRQLESIAENAATVDDAEAFRKALDDVAEQYRNENQISVEEAESQAWSAKTENAEREVPFDWSPRAEIAVERFFDVFDQWNKSMSALRRRLDKSLELAEGLEVGDTTPHGLRATAASHVAGKGLEAPALQAMFGWASIQTAQNYISSSPDNTQTQLNQLA